MALKAAKKLDNKLVEMYENQTTTNVSAISATPFVDRSDVLLQQMNFIALNNKSFLNLR